MDTDDPSNCAKNCARGEAPSRWPVFKSCMRSPACIAPASANAPATMFVTTWPGATRAKMICENFPTPLTGLRSVCPSALTARTEIRHETATASATCQTGMANIGEMTATARTVAANMPPPHHDSGTNCNGGATSRASPLLSASISLSEATSNQAAGALRRSGTNWRKDVKKKDVRASASIRPIATHSTQPWAPPSHAPTGPGAQPFALAMGPSTAHAVIAPPSIENAGRGPMIIPCPT
mmetsp:Transcript_115787/g.327508  ORF Transcript_115787/g.327508 Transcript_115787/m.327508 type:complete len:239 (+) Transcript_115787:539-1255(+)